MKFNFLNEIVHIVEKLAEEGHRVVVAGLDMDFRGEPFDPMPQIMAVSEQVTKHKPFVQYVVRHQVGRNV